MKKYSFKQLQMFFMAILGVALFTMTSCKKDDAEPGTESQIANKEWQTEGLYVNGTKTVSPNIRLEFTTGAIANTFKVNGITNPGAIWSINGLELRITYPKFDGTQFTGVETKDFTITRLTDTELWFKVAGSQEVNFLGLITLNADSEYRMNLSGAANTVTSDELTAVTWDGNDMNDAKTRGIFTNGNWTSTAPITMKFGTTLGFNHVTISGFPAPATWELNADKTQLTIVYPANGSISGGTTVFDIKKLTSTELDLGTSNSASLGGIITLSADNELRMTPQ